MMIKIKLLMFIIFYLIILVSVYAVGGIVLGVMCIIYFVDVK